VAIPALPGALLADELCALLDIVDQASETDLIRATGCLGWRVADLIVHLRLDAEGILSGLASPSAAPPDRDYVSYWRDWPAAGPATFADVRWTWAAAAMYASSAGLRQHFRDVTQAAARAVSEPARAPAVQFQRHVLAAGDFLAMWLTEYVLHHLDLVAELPWAPGPGPAGLDLAAATVDGLAGGPRLPAWDTGTYVRKGTGRVPLTDDERAELGPRAARYPVFG
jgi:hypothetical protein